MKTFWAVFVAILLVVALCAIGAFIEGAILFWLWNWLMPLIWAGAPLFTYWQCFGICILLNFIGSFFKSSVTVKRN